MSILHTSSNHYSKAVVGLENRPLVKSLWSLFSEHGYSTVEGAAVLALGGVHVSCLHNINRRSNNCGAETSSKCRCEVAGKIICEEEQL